MSFQTRREKQEALLSALYESDSKQVVDTYIQEEIRSGRFLSDCINKAVKQ